MKTPGEKSIAIRITINFLNILVALLLFPKAIAATSVVTWGSNNLGQGNVPPNLTNAVSIAAGAYHNLALKSDGKVIAWGSNMYTQTNTPSNLTNVVGIAAGWSHSYVVKSDRSVVAWGAGTANTGIDPHHGQSILPSGLSNVIRVGNHVGYNSIVLKGNNSIVVWGNAAGGQTNIPPGLSNVVAVAGGGSHCVALKADGTVVAWGTNDYGQLNVPVGLQNVVAISAGTYHCLALRADGTLAAWGRNDQGQVSLPIAATNVVAISSGWKGNIALKADGTVVAWGYWQSSPSPNLTNVVGIAAGRDHGMALVDTGSSNIAYSLTNPEHIGDEFRASVLSQIGKVYRLEYKNSLEGEAWTYLPLVAGNGVTLTLSDITATNSQRFYRIRKW
jgi:alpha-tubulin suppressor-like RCC1 family protein